MEWHISSWFDALADGMAKSELHLLVQLKDISKFLTSMTQTNHLRLSSLSQDGALVERFFSVKLQEQNNVSDKVLDVFFYLLMGDHHAVFDKKKL